MEDKIKKLRIKEIDDRISNLRLNIKSMQSQIDRLNDRKHQLVSEDMVYDKGLSEIYPITENQNKDRQEYIRQKNLINGKIASLKKVLKELDIKYWKKELDNKIKSVSENEPVKIFV